MSGLLSRRAFLGRSTASSDTIQTVPSGAMVAAVGGGCLAAQGVMCGTCSDPCQPRALRVRPLGGGRALPVIDASLCDGCGDCLMVCPVAALTLIPAPQESAPCA